MQKGICKLWVYNFITWEIYAYFKLKAFDKVSPVEYFRKEKPGVIFRLKIFLVIFFPTRIFTPMKNQKLESTLRAASILLPAQLLHIGMVRTIFLFLHSGLQFYMDRKWRGEFSVLNITGYSSSTNFYGTWQKRMAKQTWIRKRIYWRSYKDRVSSQTATHWVIIFNPFF